MHANGIRSTRSPSTDAIPAELGLATHGARRFLPTATVDAGISTPCSLRAGALLTLEPRALAVPCELVDGGGRFRPLQLDSPDSWWSVLQRRRGRPVGAPPR